MDENYANGFCTPDSMDLVMEILLDQTSSKFEDIIELSKEERLLSDPEVKTIALAVLDALKKSKNTCERKERCSQNLGFSD